MVMSGSQRSKEDDVQKISTFVFVINFPDGYGAKDLWNTCKLYGHVVDVFISDRRTKDGKRFGFVRFLKVNSKGTYNVNHGAKDMTNSYANVVKGNQVQNVGKVKEFASLTNLKVVLGKERYANIELKYTGDKRVIWVEVEGVPCKWWSRNTFSRITSRWGTLLNEDELEEEGYHSNRIYIRMKLKTVMFDTFKMIYRGMTCWVHAIEVPGWVPDFEEDGKEGYDVNDGSHEDDMHGGVLENLKDVQNDVHFEEPFGIYEVLNKKRNGKNIDDKHEDSLKYPPGFTPNEEGDVPIEKVDNGSDENRVNDGQEDGDGEVVIVGDFNEVCDISERFGSIFNKHGAEAFNSFIVNEGLVEIWARQHKKSLNSRKSILKAELADLDEVIDKGEGLDADGHRRREVVRWIQEVEKVDAMEVAQKAKIKWSIDGEENLKYYHGVLNKKRGHLTIRRVLVDGIWMESPHLVRHEFFEHFKNRFEKPNKRRILLERDFVKRISLEQNDDLEREVSNDEIKRAVWDCGIDKAPGPDGFTFGGNSSFITLIPKVPNANMVKDFRPISLIGSLYKVISKVLENRLVTVDFEKAYDSVRWDYIDDILRRFGFGEKWCNWIQSCLYSSRGSVLVNGSPTKEFQFHKGLKQGSRVGDLMSRIQSWHGVIEGMHTRSYEGALKYGIYLCVFFNGADVISKKPSRVRWKSVLAAKDVGILGVSGLFALNRALMFKWVWRFFSPKNSLWVRVVKALHGEDEKIAWCGDIAFKNLVPRLYALESMKNIEVASKLSHEGLEFSFRRNSRGGVEQTQFERLKEMVEGVTLSNSNDRCSWSLVGSGDFSMSSVMKLIDNAILLKGISKTRWIKERNLKIFGQEDPSMVNVYDKVVYRSFYWIRFRCKVKFSFIDWLKNPNLVLLSIPISSVVFPLPVMCSHCQKKFPLLEDKFPLPEEVPTARTILPLLVKKCSHCRVDELPLLKSLHCW
nr:RNA-directed DNA polymerase, eukaryota [Tanacetum cinerariifolium]